MERGSNKVNPELDDQMKHEVEPLVRSNKEGHVEPHLEKESVEGALPEEEGQAPSGHRIAGTGSSADEYNWKDHGETGGESHPKPKGDE